MVHDTYIQERYPWIREVFDKIDKIVAVHERSYNSVLRFMGHRTLFDIGKNYDVSLELIRFPVDLSDMGRYEKKPMIIQTNVWKSWKNNHVLVYLTPFIKEKYPYIDVIVYGNGIEKAKMSGQKRSDRYFIDGYWIWDRAIESGMIDRHVVSDEEIYQGYKDAKYHVSFATSDNYKRGYKGIDYADVEAMKYGCILFRPRDAKELLEPNLNYVPIDFTDLKSAKEDFLRYLEAIESDEYNTDSMIENNFRILKQYFDDIMVANAIVEVIE